MSREPTRWLESTERPELLSLMRVGADELAPPDVLARVGERLRQASLASEPTLSSTDMHTNPSGSRGATTGVGVKTVGTAVLLLGLALSLYLTLRSGPQAPVQTSASSLPQRPLFPDTGPVAPAPLAPQRSATQDTLADDAPPAAAAVQAAEAEPVRRPPKGHPQSRERPGQPSVQPVDTRLLEAKLLEQARQELSARPEHALALLRDHALQFPASWLEEERAALTIRALVAAGQRTEARTQLTRFGVRFPGSVHTERLARALAAP